MISEDTVMTTLFFAAVFGALFTEYEMEITVLFMSIVIWRITANDH